MRSQDSNVAEKQEIRSTANKLDDLEKMETPMIINCDTVPPGHIYKSIELNGRRYIYARLKTGQWFEGFCGGGGYTNYEQEFAYSHIPTIYKGKALKDFRTDVYSTCNLDAANTALRFATNYVKKFDSVFHTEGMGLYFYSEMTGCGKTLIACIIANELIARGINVKFIKAINFYEKLKSEINDNSDAYSKSDTMNDMKKVDVLILDDLGAENVKSYERTKFYHLIDHRLNDRNKKVTIFTSSKPFSRLPYDTSILELIKQRTTPVILPKENVGDKLISKKNKVYQDILNE